MNNIEACEKVFFIDYKVNDKEKTKNRKA